MKRSIIISSAVIILVALGFITYTFNTNSFAMGMGNWNNPFNFTRNNYDNRINDEESYGRTNNSGYGMMGRFSNDSIDNYNYNRMDDNYRNGRSNNYSYGRGMMGGYNDRTNSYNNDCGYGNSNGYLEYEDYNENELFSLDALSRNVEKYISYFDKQLEIEDIFIFSNSEYYFSIVEEDTGKGAMELLVDPITGYVFPEYGPNMMWNLEYGMHGNNDYGMRGMMGGYNFNVDYENYKKIDKTDALELANNYIALDTDSDLIVEAGGHEFYGYYTFHVNEGEETVGMLSVNYYTGEIWYHDWHGVLVEIVSAHQE